MGLDITSYSNLVHVGEHDIDPELNEGEPGPWCYYDDHVQAFAYDCFSASFRGIPVLGRRDANGSRFLYGGCYAITEKTETIGFQAGSYTGYNAWRDDLRSQFNPDLDPDGPFYELIWFADNEGSIGPEAAADLLADFLQYADAYDPEQPEDWHPQWAQMCREKYADWTRAFELAASGGIVRFH